MIDHQKICEALRELIDGELLINEEVCELIEQAINLVEIDSFNNEEL